MAVNSSMCSPLSAAPQLHEADAVSPLSRMRVRDKHACLQLRTPVQVGAPRLWDTPLLITADSFHSDELLVKCCTSCFYQLFVCIWLLWFYLWNALQKQRLLTYSNPESLQTYKTYLCSHTWRYFLWRISVGRVFCVVSRESRDASPWKPRNQSCKRRSSWCIWTQTILLSNLNRVIYNDSE